MPNVVIRPAAPIDFETICALNLAEVQHTSGMDVTRLAELDAISCSHKVACLDGNVSAFLLAMCNGARYENDNFSWFSKMYQRFIYVDRVVVSSDCRGQRLGSRLYEDVLRHASSNAIPSAASIRSSNGLKNGATTSFATARRLRCSCAPTPSSSPV